MYSLGTICKSQEKLETKLMQYLGGQKRVLWYFPKWPISLPCKPLENATPQSKQVSNGEGSWCISSVNIGLNINLYIGVNINFKCFVNTDHVICSLWNNRNTIYCNLAHSTTRRAMHLFFYSRTLAMSDTRKSEQRTWTTFLNA